MDTMSCFVHRILFLGAVVCVTASATLMMDYNWPKPDRNINKFPHESSCHYYYLMLSEEDITVEKCPDGQLFDYVRHSCISDKEHIHCWSRHFGKMKHDHLHMKHKKHFKCPYPWGKYPNLHDCSKYHLCLNNKSRVKKCAHYELFDKISRKCVASIDAVCADKTDVVEHGYVCPKTWGSFTYSKDCSKYYECLKRKPTLRTCQKGKLFDDRLRKCSPNEHVYCGLRHNPYEKVSSDVPSTTAQKSTTSNPQEASSTIRELTSTLRESSSTIKKVASTSPEASSTTKEDKSTSPEDSSTVKEVTSTSPEASSTIKEVTSTSPEASSTVQEVTSTSPEASSTINEVTSTSPEASSTVKEVTSTSPEASSTVKEVPSTSPEVSSTIKEVTSTNQPTYGNPSSLPEADNEESKQETTLDPNAIVKSEMHQKSNDLSNNVSTKKEFIAVPSTTDKVQIKIASDEQSEDEKKDVSTEEKYMADVSKSGNAQGGSADSSGATGCSPEDSMCTTEKDGTVVKCSNSKDLQPHPKDERRFLDCTEGKIQIYTCPPGLTFHPDTKKCKWQFIMG